MLAQEGVRKRMRVLGGGEVVGCSLQVSYLMYVNWYQCDHLVVPRRGSLAGFWPPHILQL